MQLEEFNRIVKKLSRDLMVERDGYDYGDAYYEDDEYYFNGKEISVRWVVGGQEGGNCWSDGGHYPVAAEPEPEFKILDMVLEATAPNISYLDFKELMKLVKVEHSSHSGYYGNYTEYKSKILSVDDLWNFITERGLFKDSSAPKKR